MTETHTYDPALALRILAGLYAAAAALVALSVGAAVGAKLGVLAFLLAATLGLLLGGASTVATMAVLDLRRASARVTS